MSAIFISHAKEDIEATQNLKGHLQSWNHHSLFIDFDPEAGIRAGRSWERTLYRKMRACRAVVALVTDTYVKSYWCFTEIALARMDGKPIFAMLDPSLSPDAVLPSILTEKQYIDLRIDEENGFSRLKNGLKELDILGTSGDWDPHDAPYLGLSHYDEKHAPVFFGREDEIRTGMELINRGAPNLIMVLGASGSGKSSLTRAGILPRLRMEQDQFLVVEPFRPRQDPFRELADVLERARRRFAPAGATSLTNDEEIRNRLIAWRAQNLPNTPGESDPETEPASLPPGDAESESQSEERLHALLAKIEDLKGELPRSPETSSLTFLDWTVEDLRRITTGVSSQAEGANHTPLLDLASQLELSSERRHARVILVIDQFEELLGYEDDPDHPANRFLDQLRATLDAENCPLLVVGTMRSDFLGTFQRNPALRGIDFESLSLGPMKPEGMRRVIEEPAKLGAIVLGKGLADRLLADTETPDALPLLSFTLWVLWRDYREDGKLSVSEYKELGGLDGAIAREADALLRSAETEGKVEPLRRAFVHMARLTDQGSYARQPVNWDAVDLQPVHEVLDRFVNRRLLVKQVEGDETLVEVAHEALFRSWAPLKTWLDENRADLLLRHQIKRDAMNWEVEGRPGDQLWHGSRIQQAQDLMKRNGLVGEQEQFVRAGIKRRRTRRRILAGITMSVFAVLAGFLAFAVTLAKIADRAREQAVLGRDAARFNDGEGSLLRSRVAEQNGNRFPDRIFHAARAAGFDQFGRQEASSDDLLVQFPILVPHAAEQCRSIVEHGVYLPFWKTKPATGQGRSISFSPEGRYVAGAFADGKIRVWDFADADADQPLKFTELRKGGSAPCRVVEFSVTGKLAAATDEGVIFWSQIGGEGRLIFTGLATALAWNGATNLLAVGFADGSIQLWDESKAAPHPFAGKCEGAVTQLDFSADQKNLATGDKAGSVRLWGLEGKTGTELVEKGKKISAIAFSPKQNILAAAGEQLIRLWDADGTQLGSLEPQSTLTATALTFRPDGRILAASYGIGDDEGLVRIWNVENPTDPQELATLVHDGVLQDLDFSPGGQTVGTISNSGVLTGWDVTRTMAVADSVPQENEHPNLFAYFSRNWYRFKGAKFTTAEGAGGLVNLPGESTPGTWATGQANDRVEKVFEKLVRGGNFGAAQSLLETLGNTDTAINAASRLAEEMMKEAQAAAGDYRWNLAGVRLNQLHNLDELPPEVISSIETLEGQRPGRKEQSFKNGEKMEMVWCKPGEFTMGQLGKGEYETPHQVTLTKGFWIAAHEVTQRQWESVMANRPWNFVESGLEDASVENVSWEVAVKFCKRLTDREREKGAVPEGWEYHLPTEAQWEYACRAGTTTVYSFGDEASNLPNYAWFKDNGGFKTHLVGKKKQNAWGLYDMHGNVLEWVRDAYGKFPKGEVNDPFVEEGPWRVARGGGWGNGADDCRSAYRRRDPPFYRDDSRGLRAALVPSGAVRDDSAH